MEIQDNYKTIYDEIEKDDGGNKLINDVINEPESFYFHIANTNIRISVVLIKKAWKIRGKITDYVLKKKFKSTKNIKQRTKSKVRTVKNTKDSVKEIKTIDPMEFTGDREWCWKEFERHIGVPKRWDVHPSFAISYIRGKRSQQYVPEAKNLKRPDGTGSVFLASDNPKRNCLCPEHECLCFGDKIIKKRMKIPNNNWRRWHSNVFEKKADVAAFMKNFSDLSSGSTEKKKQMNNNMLSKDICINKCRQCLVSEKPQTLKYLPAIGLSSPVPKVMSEVVTEVFEEPKESVRNCNVVFCTAKCCATDAVSTQTDNGPDGELLIDQSINFTHVLFANNEETYLPDIRGTKLQITRYTCVSSKGPDMQVCAKNMEKFLDFKEMKTRLTKFISSIYEIKDPGIPVRNSSTQVPWRKRICESLKTRPPDRCRDEDYDNLPKVPWHWRKMHEATCEDMKKDEVSVEEDNDDICSCCELFMESGIDKEALLEDMRNILSLPGDVTMTKDELIKDENISDVTTIIEEIIANTFDDIAEKMKKNVELIEAGNEGYKGNNNQKKDHVIQEKDHTERTNEGIENNTLETDKEMEKNAIINENRNSKESVDKNITHTNEFITVNDNSKLNDLIDAGKVSDEITTDEINNNKKKDKSKKIRSKKSCLLSYSKTRKQKLSVSIEGIKNSKDKNEEIIVNDNNGIEINTVQQKLDDQLKKEFNKDLFSSSKINKKSSILKEGKVTSNIENTSDKIVLRLKTSGKKASSAFLSLFKWLYGKPIQTSEFDKKSSVKSIPKGKYSIDEAKLNEKDSKNSEKEVFSIRYTSSSITVNKSSCSGTDL